MAACGGHSVAPPRPNVLLITIDTFRADRVGIGVAPAIDRLAASGIRFTSARTAVPLTLPSHTTIHTGLLPPAHGVRENGIDTLASTHQTMATLLKGAGYDTAAFVGAFVLDHRFGLAQGFDTYDDQIPRDPDATRSPRSGAPGVGRDRSRAGVARAAIAGPKGPGLQSRPALAQPPAPSPSPSSCGSTSTIRTRPTPRRRSFSRGGRTPYDGEIAYADSQLARSSMRCARAA